MTYFGMYRSHTRDMLNIEYARILQAERERAVEAELRQRRLLRSGETDETQPRDACTVRGPQRATSTGVVSR